MLVSGRVDCRRPPDSLAGHDPEHLLAFANGCLQTVVCSFVLKEKVLS